jgi:glycosyltransferase involved in cell wall biosynthesis
MKKRPVVMLLPYDSCSGLELFGLRFARDLLDRGHEAVVAAPDNSILARQCSDRDIPRFHFPAAAKYHYSSYPAALETVKTLDPAAVVAFRTQMMYPVHLARLLGRRHFPMLLFYRIGAGSYFRRDPLHRIMFRQVAAVVPNADHVKNKILKYWGIDAEKVVCIKSGVDTSRYYPDQQRRQKIRRELGIDENAVIIGSSGRIHPEKGSEILLRALFDADGAACNRKDVHLVYVGREYESGYAGHLQSVAESLGAGKRFHIMGFRNDVETVYSAFDIFAFAVTSSEAYAYVVLEAMASGIAPVVPATGGLVEMFTDGTEGFFFKHRDNSSLRLTLAKALALPTENLRQMQHASRKRIVQTADWRKMMEKYDELFQRCGVAGF